MLKQHGATPDKNGWHIRMEKVQTHPAELFSPNEFVQYWNPDWTLERAGYGAPGGGHRGIRGGTFVDGNVLSTFPRDETRGVVLRRSVKLPDNPSLTVMVGADPGRAWKLEIMIDHEKIHTQLIDGGEPLPWEGITPVAFPPPTEEYLASTKARQWHPVTLDITKYAGQEVVIRLYQHSLVRNRYPGNAYWKDLRLTAGKPKP